MQIRRSLVFVTFWFITTLLTKVNIRPRVGARGKVSDSKLLQIILLVPCIPKFHSHQFNRCWHISMTMMVSGDRQSQWDSPTEDHECLNKVGTSWEIFQLRLSGQWFRSLKFILYDFKICCCSCFICFITINSKVSNICRRWKKKKALGSPKSGGIHLLGTMNVWTKFFADALNRCWDISKNKSNIDLLVTQEEKRGIMFWVPWMSEKLS